MLTALTRKVSPRIAACELEYLDRQPIDLAKAQDQHQSYEACLTELGVRVISLPTETELPDCVFVEDPAIVVDEVAIITHMGASSRRKEGKSLAAALSGFRPLRKIEPPATLEGGDVLRIGKTLYAGLSRRSDRSGVVQLAQILYPFGYRVVPIEVLGCLHLKSAVSCLDDGTILANQQWIDPAHFKQFRIIDVPKKEPGAANVLRIGDVVLVPSSFPRTGQLLSDAGFTVRHIDTSELQKAEAGLTCMSIRFET